MQSWCHLPKKMGEYAGGPLFIESGGCRTMALASLFVEALENGGGTDDGGLMHSVVYWVGGDWGVENQRAPWAEERRKASEVKGSEGKGTKDSPSFFAWHLHFQSRVPPDLSDSQRSYQATQAGASCGAVLYIA